jgi:hypothetical protein
MRLGQNIARDFTAVPLITAAICAQANALMDATASNAAC